MTKRRGLDSEAARDFTGKAPKRRRSGTETPDTSDVEVKASESTTTAGKLLRRTCYFAPEEWAAVLAAAKATDRSAAAFIRYAVREYLEEQGLPVSRGAKVVSGKDAAE